MGHHDSGTPRTHVTPLVAPPEPRGLEALGLEVSRQWPMTGLIDVLKQCALDTGFLDAFSFTTDRVMPDRDTMERCILMCLYAYGAKTGLQRVETVNGPFKRCCPLAYWLLTI